MIPIDPMGSSVTFIFWLRVIPFIEILLMFSSLALPWVVL
jgi:hypothetical protein